MEATSKHMEQVIETAKRKVDKQRNKLKTTTARSQKRCASTRHFRTLGNTVILAMRQGGGRAKGAGHGCLCWSARPCDNSHRRCNSSEWDVVESRMPASSNLPNLGAGVS
jgi:hypothetical protein